MTNLLGMSGDLTILMTIVSLFIFSCICLFIILKGNLKNNQKKNFELETSTNKVKLQQMQEIVQNPSIEEIQDNKVNIIKQNNNSFSQIEKSYIVNNRSFPKKDLLQYTKFFPLISVGNNTNLLHLRYIRDLKKLLENKNIILISEENNIDKDLFISNFSREYRFNFDFHIVSYSFSPRRNNLQEALEFILVEQLKINLGQAELQDLKKLFCKIVSEDNYLIIFENIELLTESDLFFFSDPKLFFKSKIILLSNCSLNLSFSLPNLKIKNQNIKPELIRAILLDKIKTNYGLNPILMNEIINFCNGNILKLNLFIANCELSMNNNELNFSMKHLIHSMRNYELSNLINFTIAQLTQLEREIINFCTKIPLSILSSSLLVKRFGLDDQVVFNILYRLSNAGLLQILANESFQNASFRLNPSFKEYLTSDLNELDFLVNYFNDLKSQKKLLQRESLSFIIELQRYLIEIYPNEKVSKEIEFLFLNQGFSTVFCKNIKRDYLLLITQN